MTPLQRHVIPACCLYLAVLSARPSLSLPCCRPGATRPNWRDASARLGPPRPASARRCPPRYTAPRRHGARRRGPTFLPVCLRRVAARGTRWKSSRRLLAAWRVERVSRATPRGGRASGACEWRGIRGSVSHAGGPCACRLWGCVTRFCTVHLMAGLAVITRRGAESGLDTGWERGHWLES